MIKLAAARYSRYPATEKRLDDFRNCASFNRGVMADSASATPSNAAHDSYDRDFIQPGVLEGEQIQLTPCSVEPLSLHWQGQDTEVLLYSLGAWICARERLATRDFHFNVVLEAEPPVHWNGRRLENGDGIRFGTNDAEFSLLPPNTLLLCVRANRSVAEAREWTLESNEVYSFPKGEQKRLLALSKAQLNELGGKQPEASRRVRSRSDGYVETITRILDEGCLRKATRDRIHPKRHQLVTAALDLLDRQDARFAAQAQKLAERLGVTGKTLENAFHTCLNTTPYRFILLKRLHQVRRELILHEPRHGFVTEAALDAGFENLSRKSRMYRELFRETPQQTLERRR